MIRVLDKGFVELVDKMGNDVALKVVNSARLSFGGKSEDFNAKDKKLAQYLMANKHTSPYRHSYYTFQVKMPLFVARQFFKHQIGSTWVQYEVDGNPVTAEMFELYFDSDKGCSWNEKSARYSEFEPEFYVPEKMRGKDPKNKQGSGELWEDNPIAHEAFRVGMEQSYKDCHELYKHMVSLGIAKEMARLVLPVSIYTTVTWTISLQAIIHFLELRLDSHAQFEAQEYAKAIYELVKPDLEKLGITREDLC